MNCGLSLTEVDMSGIEINSGISDTGSLPAFDPVLPPASPPMPLPGGRQYPPTLPEHAVRSKEAFLADLPELLQSHPGGAVAYADGRRIGLGSSRRDLFWKLVKEGHDPAIFFVFAVEQPAPTEVEILFEP